MAQISVAPFAGELKVQPAVLLEQLRAAGVTKSLEGDLLSDQDKARLLDYLRKSHGQAGEGKNRITLTRRQTTEIKKSDSSGKARTIQVEVRKKRVFVKRDASEAPVPGVEAAAAAVLETDGVQAEPPVEVVPVVDELAVRQEAELREKMEREKRLAEQREAEQRAAEEEARRA